MIWQLFFRWTIHEKNNSVFFLSPQSVTHVILIFWSKTFEKGATVQLGKKKSFCIVLLLFCDLARNRAGRPLQSKCWPCLLQNCEPLVHFFENPTSMMWFDRANPMCINLLASRYLSIVFKYDGSTKSTYTVAQANTKLSKGVFVCCSLLLSNL